MAVFECSCEMIVSRVGGDPPTFCPRCRRASAKFHMVSPREEADSREDVPSSRCMTDNKVNDASEPRNHRTVIASGLTLMRVV